MLTISGPQVEMNGSLAEATCVSRSLAVTKILQIPRTSTRMIVISAQVGPVHPLCPRVATKNKISNQKLNKT